MYNDQILKKRRQELRTNQTDCEGILWSKLRNRACNGYKFLRQYSVGSYIVDFYCPKLRLSIELDGGQHNDSTVRDYDKQRTEYLRSNNIVELRFWNSEVKDNLDGVYQKILEYCI